MNNRTAILLAIGVGGTGVLIGLFLSRSNAVAAAEQARAADLASVTAARSQEMARTPNPPDLERPDSRVPALTERPEPATEAAPTPPVATPAAPEVVGDPNSWPAEYAGKSIAELTADWERLNEEFEKDLKAEFERRIQDGRCETYPYDMQSLLGKRKTSGSSGFYLGRKVENTWKAVTFDPGVEPDLFIKRNKAGWLSGEIGRRQQ